MRLLLLVPWLLLILYAHAQHDKPAEFTIEEVMAATSVMELLPESHQALGMVTSCTFDLAISRKNLQNFYSANGTIPGALKQALRVSADTKLERILYVDNIRVGTDQPQKLPSVALRIIE